MANAAIITIGDELLIGQVIDTNSAWMAQELNKIGVDVVCRMAVGDDAAAITNALDAMSSLADVVLITGGLGPTADDITKPLLCGYFGGSMIQNELALENVEHLFRDVFNRPITERNRLQAMVPDVCEVLQNSAGTAPGMLFKKDGKFFVSMPGVPFEMQEMMRKSVLPFLQQELVQTHIAHKTLITAGIGESTLADLVQDIEEALPPYIKLAYLPSYGMVRLRLTARKHYDGSTSGDELSDFFHRMQERVAQYLVAAEDVSMTQALGNTLLDAGRTMCTAESCTGGYISHLITSLPGSSNWFAGSVVSYSNDAKQAALRVKEETLRANGAVSEQTVREMLLGALAATRASCGVATSGIMGPGGGSDAKPVGTVWIAAGDAACIWTKAFHLRFDRLKNIQAAAFLAQKMLREFVLGINEADYTVLHVSPAQTD